MSTFSDQEENELISFENLEIFELFEDDSEIEAAECIDINSDKKKIILIKMNKSIKSKTSGYSKSQNNNPKKEEIHELKYNLYLGLFRDCVPAVEIYKEIMKDRNLMGHRVTMQKIVIDKEQKFFHPKEYIFIPPNENNDLYFTINKDKVLKISKDKKVTMQLGKGFGDKFEKTKDLKKLNEKAEPDIANKIAKRPNDKISENDNNPINEIKINFDKNNEGSKSINNEIETRSEKSISLKSMLSNGSKSNLDSSEKEIENGALFYDEIKEGTEYMRYSFYDNYKKEIDGIYCEHPAIKLETEEKELKFGDYTSYQGFMDEYDKANKKNDLNGYIIMKNFEEKIIPENAPFIIEIKAGFELFELLKQIKKASKYVNNMQNNEVIMPKYFIGILCSFDSENTLLAQFDRLNKAYDGSNSKDKDSKINWLTHTTNIIGKNINFVIAVLKDRKINGYNLANNDYDVNLDYKRVDLLYMYKTINEINELNGKELDKINQKISTVRQNFSNAYHTFNDEKLFSTSYSKKNEYEKKNKEEKKKLEEEKKKLEEKINKLEEKIKKMEEERNKMEEKMQEERNKMQEKMQEERNKMQEKMQEERNKMQEEINRIEEKMQEKLMNKMQEKMQEERNKMQEKMQEERNKMQEELMNKMQEKMQEELMNKMQEKMQEELMKKIQDGRKEIETENKKMPEEIEIGKKKMPEENANKTNEYKSQTEQVPYDYDEKNKKAKKDINQ